VTLPYITSEPSTYPRVTPIQYGYTSLTKDPTTRSFCIESHLKNVNFLIGSKSADLENRLSTESSASLPWLRFSGAIVSQRNLQSMA